jgi:signal transduction histidine kinase
MEISSRISFIRRAMYFINVAIILFFSYIISSTTTKICESFQAREFIERAQYLSIIPRNILVFSMSFMIALGLSNVLKNRLVDKNTKGILLLLGLDFIFCSLIVYYLNYSYRGIYMILIINIIYYVKNNRTRFLALTLVLIFYVFSDYDVLSSRLVMISLNEYVDYYTNEVRFLMLAGKNILISINDIGFIVFLYFSLQTKINENKEIRMLNRELRATASELEVANIHLRELARTSEENVKMKERNRLAREIHDILGHSLTSITTGIEACIAIIDSNTQVAKEQLVKILDLSKKGLVDVRRSVRELKIDSIAKAELIPAIETLVKDINECTPVSIDLKIKGEILKLKDDEDQTVYRIIQESITNAIRHGHANNIQILMEYLQYQLNITISDDGSGAGEITDGFGLTHIRERIEMLQGQMEINTDKGQGFELKVEIPIRWGNAYD